MALTVGFIGCGNMGGAVLKGVLDAAFPTQSAPSDVAQPSSVPKASRFIACTKTESSADRLKDSFSPEQQLRIQFLHSSNLQTMQEADVVILGCKPYMAEDILGAKGVLEALAGKLVISLLAGQTPSSLLDFIQVGAPSHSPKPVVIRAIPTMGAQFRQSITVIETPDQPIATFMAENLEWIFQQIGEIKYLPSNLFEVGTLVGGGAMAALTLPIEGLLDGCVAEGIKRPEAIEIVIGGLRGLTAILESGTHPAVLRESISSPRGCTIHALLTLERAGTRAAFAEAIINGTSHLKK